MPNQRYKEPWLAVFLSVVTPGASIIYLGKRKTGFFCVFIQLFCIVSACASMYRFFFTRNPAVTRCSFYLFILSIISILLLHSFSIVHSYKKAKFINRQCTDNIGIDEEKSPWVSFFLSFLLPGVGQIYNRQFIKGFICIFIFFYLNRVSNSYYSFLVILIFFDICVLDDAYRYALKLDTKLTRFELLWKSRSLTALIMFALLLFNIPYYNIITTYFLQTYQIPSESMAPTLKTGDRIFAKKITSVDDIKRGQVVVFRYPSDPSKYFIKRVIGLPHDKLQVMNKRVFINNIAYEDLYSHRVESTIKVPRDFFGPVYVPFDSYFVMGDNRDNSFDSRYWGFIKKGDIVGEGMKIYWSWDERNKRIDWYRIGQPL